MSDIYVKVRCRTASSNEDPTRDEEGLWTGFEVEIGCGSGSETTRGLTWDEMLGQVASAFQAPRLPIYRPNIPRKLAEEENKATR